LEGSARSVRAWKRKLPPIRQYFLNFLCIPRPFRIFLYRPDFRETFFKRCSDPHPSPLQNVGDPVEYGVPVGHMLFHSYTGEIDKMADRFEKIIEQRYPLASGLPVGSAAAALRTSPRRIQLAKMMNLPQIN